MTEHMLVVTAVAFICNHVTVTQTHTEHATGHAEVQPAHCMLYYI